MLPIFKKFFNPQIPRSIDAEYDRILRYYSSYYQGLAVGWQRNFRYRLYRLLSTVAFESPAGRVGREARVVIGSAIIQITFGLEHYLPRMFRRVVVMPQRYMYPGYGQPFLGHTDKRAGKVYFSWPDVKHGYLVPNDAVNVALHEMAHVLDNESTYNPIYAKFFARIDWDTWARTAFRKMETIRAGQHEFLKSYGGINMAEMFAVCVETFFEQPAEFRAALPELYATVRSLLKQDPLVADHPPLNRQILTQ